MATIHNIWLCVETGSTNQHNKMDTPHVQELVDVLKSDVPAPQLMCDPVVREQAARTIQTIKPDSTPLDGRILLSLVLFTVDETALQRPAYDGTEETIDQPPTLDGDAQALLEAAKCLVSNFTLESYQRATALLDEWKSATQREVAAWVLDSISMRRLHTQSVDVEKPSVLFAQARALGVEEEANKRWQMRIVTPEEVQENVKQCVTQAFWDSIVQKLKETRDYSVLFSLSRELKGLMMQLLHFAPRVKQEVEDKVDVDILEQVAEQTMAHPDDPSFFVMLRSVILFIAGTITRMVCAADVAECEMWKEQVRDQLTGVTDFHEYLQTHFMLFLRKCFERLERIASQIHALTQETQEEGEEGGEGGQGEGAESKNQKND